MSCESQINYFTMKHKISLRDSYIGDMVYWLLFRSVSNKTMWQEKNVDDMLGGG